MPVAITMRGMLEPIVLEESFLEATMALNNAAAQGKEFIASQNMDGDNVAVALRNILSIQETEEEF